MATGASWKYYDAGGPGNAWKWPAYDDSAWRSGAAQLGFGDGDEVTPVTNDPARITTYFRHTFNVADAQRYRSLTVRVLCDDGAVVWLNGVEVFRNNMPPAGAIEFNTGAVSDIAGAAENAFVTFHIDARALRTGTNVIAVEVHQFGTASDDLSFDLELTADRRFCGIANCGWRDMEIPRHRRCSRPAWTTAAYNDSAWSSGRARLGYGGDGEVTPVGCGPDARIAIAQPGSGVRSMSRTHPFSMRCGSNFNATMARSFT